MRVINIFSQSIAKDENGNILFHKFYAKVRELARAYSKDFIYGHQTLESFQICFITNNSVDFLEDLRKIKRINRVKIAVGKIEVL